ncbi:MAG TPA: choice-of-anchor D domain-containing protein, partial [Saprospiraceae bacterium]|nr:choice-of-anchor D domain-containing protein [Saprospiraceae bacterium]
LTFKINNSGTADLNITNLPLSLSGTDADQFIITTQASSPITSGGTSDVIVQFAPTSPGAKTASISIANNDGTENPCAVNITGTGTSSPVITHTGTTPASINIAQNSTNNVLYKIQLDIATSATTLTQVLATTSGSWINGDISNFKLWYSTDANFGSDAVLSTVSNPSPGDISFATLSQAIPTGTKYLFITCDVASGAIINNTVSAFVDLDSDLSYNNTPSFSNSSFTAANLMIIIGTPELQLEYPINTNIACGGTVAFGNINVNQSSSLTFRIRNSGTGNLNLTTLPLVLGGSNAAMFTITTQPTSPISAGSFSDVVVQFLPTSTGAKTANISIANNDSDENPCSVNLTGTGVLVNDNCTGAVSLSVSSTPTCGGSTSGTTVGATSSGVSAILCNGFTGTADDDVWYSFVASSTSHIITVVGASPLDVIIDLRSGACNGTALSCADATASGGTEALIATGLTIGATYYVRVYGYDSGSGYGTFTICVTTPAPPSYFRTKQSGLWSAASTWEYSTDNMTWNDAGTAPLPTDLNIDIRSPHAIVIDVATSIDQTTVEVGSTLEISGPLTIQDGTGNDLIVMGILKNSSGTFNTTGTISIENGGKYQHNPTSSFGTIPTITWQTGSTCEIIRGNADPGTSITQNYYNFTWNSSNQSGAINLTGRLKTVNGDLTIQNTGANILRVTGSSANTLDVAGNLIIGDATKFDLGNGSASSIINVTGNLNINGTGSLDLMGGGPNNGQINLKGNLNSSASSNITENTSGTTSKIAFIGTSQQTASFGTVNNRINIEINGSPGVSLSSGLTLTSSADLKLSSGLLSLNNFDLNMGSSNTTITGGSFSSYIKTNGTGTLQRTVGGSNVTFPIGNSNYNPLVLLNTGTSDIYSARVADAVLTDGLTGIEYAQKVVDRSWIITENNSGASNVTATFQWS